MKSNIHFRSYVTKFFLELKMFQAKVVEKIKTHVLYSINFFENCTVNEIMWKNNAEPCRAEMKILSIRIAYWIPKATNTHSKYVIFIALRLQDWLHESCSMLH